MSSPLSIVTYDRMEELIARLEKEGAKRIYLSHQPVDEEKARRIALELRKHGFTAIVAADARPHKKAPFDEHDKEIIRQVIASCDFTLVVF